MVKKYLKYEWISMRRWWIPMAWGILGLALLGRLSLIPSETSEITSTTMDILVTIAQTLSGILFVVGIIAMGVITEVMIVVRYYKHMLSHEGYLTFSLPISVNKQLICKTLMAFLAQLSIVLLLLLSSFIYAVGTDGFTEFLKGVNVIFDEIVTACGTGNVVLMIIEAILTVFVGIIDTTLLYFACISVGQLMSKHRILGALLAYGAWYVISQIFGSIFSVVFILSGEQWLAKLENVENVAVIFHGISWIVILVGAALGVGFFLVSKYMLTKKLNLE